MELSLKFHGVKDIRAMPGARKPRRDKEMLAITYNMKEDRCLEKSMQTLSLEQSYSMKLLQLDHRIVKVNYKRLKDKVSRIRSHLNPDEITELKQLEIEGKLKTPNTVNIGSAVKIAAAAKRLKLQGPPPRAQTSVPTGSKRSSVESLNNNRPNTVIGSQNNLKRSNSVTGVFIDAPEPVLNNRRSSIDAGVTNIRPVSAFVENTNMINDHLNTVAKINRPATSQVLLQPPSHTPRVTNATHSPYSSHSAAEKEKAGIVVPPRANQERNTYMSSDDIDSNLGDDLQEERRQELMMEEHARFSELEDRKKEFLERIDEYLKANPVPDWSNPPPVVQLPVTEDDEEGTGSRSGSAKRGMKYRLLPNRINLDRTFRNEEEYKAKMWDLWKDLNKCRYLRIPDEMLDLSGVVTLAKDQMKLFQMLKRRDSQFIK